ncbi:MAG: DEAD/DEAH box helicase family protein, partial [Rhodospirillales bacterium]|nr:DEAD/DEAH box helicase family protein [Rhodospirillales bacterium]
MQATEPEARARQKIDAMLARSGWVVQSRDAINLHAGPGVAVREVQTRTGPADYLLFLDGRACGALEAKPEGFTLAGVVSQAEDYTAAAPANYPHWGDPLPFVFVSTGTETVFQDARDPHPRPRTVFAVHRPETLRATLKAGSSLRQRLAAMPPLDPTGLRPCQADAVRQVEASLAEGRPRALVQMATGAGKTFAACALTHRLLTHGHVRRVLFLVDRANLGRQAAGAFRNFQPAGSTTLLAEEYTVQHLEGRTISDAASVVISTVQRLYAALRGEELAEEDDERSGFDRPDDHVQHEVVYSEAIPPEIFDLVIVDECHRSIYGSWRQVLDYFDAFIVGLTATPGRHTLGFFQQNLVAEYPFERSVADGVNVDYEVWRIRTEVGERGGTVPAGFAVPHRDRTTRRQRFAELEADLPYAPPQLNRVVEVPNQIRTVLTAYRDALPTQLFPGRAEVPKTLIFCQSDAHAETVTQIAREVFAEDAHFAQKITYRATGKNGQALIKAFCNDHLFRIAATVDMVATGTDIPALEVVMFLRDVRSAQYFEQMRGRGARIILPSDLQKATPSATVKDRFLVVDAVGVTESCKTPSQPLDRERTVGLDALLERVAFGHMDEDTCSTLAARLARLALKLPPDGRKELAALAGGLGLSDLSRGLVDAIDPDRIDARAKETGAPPAEVAATMRAEACKSIATNPTFRTRLVELQRQSEIIVDELTTDAVLSAGFDVKRATEITENFQRFLETEKDRIAALGVLYARPQATRRLTYAM